MMPRQRCPFCQNTPRLEVERSLRREVAALNRRIRELEALCATETRGAGTPSEPPTGEQRVPPERMFPVLHPPPGAPTSVPWSVLAPHENQARRNHGQDLETLASRHGLAVDEMVAIIEERRWRSMSAEDGTTRLLELLASTGDGTGRTTSEGRR
jgi:hypothetical protein